MAREEERKAVARTCTYERARARVCEPVLRKSRPDPTIVSDGLAKILRDRAGNRYPTSQRELAHACVRSCGGCDVTFVGWASIFSAFRENQK